MPYSIASRTFALVLSLVALASAGAHAQRDSARTRFSVEAGPAARDVRDYAGPAHRWGASVRMGWETRQSDRVSTRADLAVTYFANQRINVTPIILVPVPASSRDLRPDASSQHDWTPATASETSLLAIGAYGAVRGYLFPHATGPFAEGGVGILRMTSHDQLDIRPAFTASVGYSWRMGTRGAFALSSRFEYLGFATNTSTIGAARSPRNMTMPLDLGLTLPLGR